MSSEIERKFTVDRLPSAHDLGSGVRIRQGYIAEDGDVEVRVRITDAVSILTIKAGGGLRRTEVESEITRDDAESLWSHTEGRRLDKTRYRLALGPHTAEVDVYEGTLAGLLVAEVEFESDADAAAFSPPEWFGTEVTGDKRWSNAVLARLGRPS